MRHLALLCVFLSVAVSAQTIPDGSAIDALIVDSLDQIGGGAVVLVAHNGTVLHRRAYGTFTTGRVVSTGSAAKWFSGGVIASLVADGTLSLDDPLSTFFPSLTGDKRAITVGQLFSHTSGIRGNENGGRAACLSERATTLAACAEAILALPLSHTPGASFDYGGNSMQVAARVSEIASDQSWVDLFDDRIAGPLGLASTGYFSDTNPAVAGSMYTSADDYGVFLQMILDGGVFEGQRVLAAEAVDAMLADQTGGATIAYSFFDTYAGYPGLPPRENVYGIGVWREQLTSDGSLLDASSPGAFGLVPWIDMERRVAGVLLVQDRLSDVVGTYVELKRLVRATVDGEAVSVATETSREDRLLSLYPNPASHDAFVRFSLVTPSPVRLILTDTLGRRIAVLERGWRRAGDHRVRIDVRSLAAGAYHVSLTSNGARRSQVFTVKR